MFAVDHLHVLDFHRIGKKEGSSVLVRMTKKPCSGDETGQSSIMKPDHFRKRKRKNHISPDTPKTQFTVQMTKHYLPEIISEKGRESLVRNIFRRGKQTKRRAHVLGSTARRAWCKNGAVACSGVWRWRRDGGASQKKNGGCWGQRVRVRTVVAKLLSGHLNSVAAELHDSRPDISHKQEKME